MPTLLVIDDDASDRRLIESTFADHPVLDIVAAESAEDGVRIVQRQSPDVVLLDVHLWPTGGMEVFRRIRDMDAKLPTVFVTEKADSDTAIEAMSLGAYDFIAKPIDLERLRDVVDSAVRARRIMLTPVEIQLDSDVAPANHLVSASHEMLEVYKAIGRVAPQDTTVLIRGESGTGKELVARAIYQHSERSEGPYRAVNSAALPDNLLESELFGHEQGAFTGADRQRIGLCEQCDGGTLFLDEVGDMSPAVQAKILRVVQQREFERVGGNETIQTDVRIIAATNRDLEQMVEDDEFREDLFYRLNGFTINLPPLRERRDDIAPLLEYFLGRLGHELERQEVEGISTDAVELLMRYDWPGNVRELESVVRQALLNATGPVIVPECLPVEVTSEPVRNGQPQPSRGGQENGLPSGDLGPFVEAALSNGTENLYAEVSEQMERYLFTRVLQATSGKQSQAARILGITRGKVANRIQAFGISLEQDVTLSEAPNSPPLSGQPGLNAPI